MKTKGSVFAAVLLFIGVGTAAQTQGSFPVADPRPVKTAVILVTSAQGAKMETRPNVGFVTGTPSGINLTVDPRDTRQTIEGIGSSFTEASAFVLAHLEPVKRSEVMRNIYGEDGANFTLTRTHIGACDFTVEGKYSYADKPGDARLESFSIAPDKRGFDPGVYPGVKDSGYDLLPMIREALSIKNDQTDTTLKIVASAWTAPSWMKDINTWYIPGSPENNWQGTGGNLKAEYYGTYADYLAEYLRNYQNEGVNIWGLTPVNEPYGVNGQWESMNFSPQTENDFVQKYLGPRLRKAGFGNVNVLIYDQNRDGMEAWADAIFADPGTVPFVRGLAVHWYESTNRVYEDVFDRIHAKYPGFSIIHTEGCIDALGTDPPGGVLDPFRFKEKDWFANDAFWWSANATDWAYSVTWQGVNRDDHPAYVPVHRYARNIIVSLDHWVSGWIDWNVVLDSRGGPNHVGNYCGAPIMIDTTTGEVYYTPVYWVLRQFSRTIRPGDRAVATRLEIPGLASDDLHACATLNADNLLSVQLLNTTNSPMVCNLRIGGQYAPVTVPANAVQTVRVQL